MTTHYEPIFRTADLPPVPMPAPQFVRPKQHRATLYQDKRPISLSALHKNGHTHALAIYGRGTRAVWHLKLGGVPESLLPFTADILQHWRIIDTATAIIAHEG